MAKQIKKTTATKKVAKKQPAKVAQVKEAPCNCEHNCPCGCHKHGFAHLLKHIIILAIVFVLGIFAGSALHFGPAKKGCPFKHMQPVFTNGCLDMSNIKCPKMMEKMMAMDANGDGCISVEEFEAAKPQHKHFKKHEHGFHHQPK